MDTQKLKSKIVEKGWNVENLADAIKMDRATLYRKLKGDVRMTIGEARKIKEVLNLSEDEAVSIFLT